MLLLRARPLRRAAPDGSAGGPHRGGSRRVRADRPTRTRRRALCRSPGVGSLFGGPCRQTRRTTRGHCTGSHAGPRGVPASHQSYWDAARRARGDRVGTRALIEILLAHRSMPATALTIAMDRAVSSGCLDPELVLIDARRHLTHRPGHRSALPALPTRPENRQRRPGPAHVETPTRQPHRPRRRPITLWWLRTTAPWAAQHLQQTAVTQQQTTSTVIGQLVQAPCHPHRHPPGRRTRRRRTTPALAQPAARPRPRSPAQP